MKKQSLLLISGLLSIGLVSCENTNNTNESSSLQEEQPIFSSDMYYQDDEKENHYHQDVSSFTSTQDEIDKTLLDTYLDEKSNF